MAKGDNVFCQTVIYDVTGTTKEGETHFSCIYNNRYILDITSRKFGDELVIDMHDDTLSQSDEDKLENARSSSLTLEKVIYDPVLMGRPSRQHTQVYAGLFNFFNWATEEVFVLVLPKGLGDGLPVSAHSQWTSTADRPPKLKINIDTVTSEQELKIDPKDSDVFEFHFGGYYRVRITKSKDAATLSVDFSQSSGGQLVHFKLRLQPM